MNKNLDSGIIFQVSLSSFHVQLSYTNLNIPGASLTASASFLHDARSCCFVTPSLKLYSFLLERESANFLCKALNRKHFQLCQPRGLSWQLPDSAIVVWVWVRAGKCKWVGGVCPNKTLFTKAGKGLDLTSRAVVSKLICTLESFGELPKMPMLWPYPKSFKSQTLGRWREVSGESSAQEGLAITAIPALSPLVLLHCFGIIACAPLPLHTVISGEQLLHCTRSFMPDQCLAHGLLRLCYINKWGIRIGWINLLKLPWSSNVCVYIYIYIYIFFFFLAAPVTYGSSRARDQIWASATTYAKAGAILNPFCQSGNSWSPNF